MKFHPETVDKIFDELRHKFDGRLEEIREVQKREGETTITLKVSSRKDGKGCDWIETGISFTKEKVDEKSKFPVDEGQLSMGFNGGDGE